MTDILTNDPVVDKFAGYYQDSDSGLILPIKGHEGVTFTSDYLDLIGIGKIAGHQRFSGFGQRTNSSAAVTGDDVWEGTAAHCPIPDQTTGEQMTLVSTSANDAAAGTGIRTIDIHGLDIAGNEQHEIVTLNGSATPVNTVRTDWRFIQAIHGESWGALGYTDGTISIYRTGDAARVYNVISIGGNMSLNAARMIPAGKHFLLKSRTISCSGGKAMSVRFRATATPDGNLTNDWRFLFKQTYYLTDAALQEILPVPDKYPPLSIVRATAFSGQAGGNVAFSYSGWIE